MPNTFKYLELLHEIKSRVGRRAFPEKELVELIKAGLVAGDHSMAYLTDAGDSVLEQNSEDEIINLIKGHGE